MKNETFIGTAAVIALFLSICAVGILYINQTDDVVDISGIASNKVLIASLVSEINNVGNDVSNIQMPSIEIDGDDLEDLEDDLNDDINDLEDDVDDLQDFCCIDGINGIDGIDGLNGADGTDGIDGSDGDDCDMSIFTCMKACTGLPIPKLNCMQDCILSVA